MAVIEIGDSGVWRISTADSWYRLNLDASTVQQRPDTGATGSEGEQRRLRTFVHCKVGRRGYWSMHPGPADPANSTIWHRTAFVLSIEEEGGDGGR